MGRDPFTRILLTKYFLIVTSTFIIGLETCFAMVETSDECCLTCKKVSIEGSIEGSIDIYSCIPTFYLGNMKKVIDWSDFYRVCSYFTINSLGKRNRAMGKF